MYPLLTPVAMVLLVAVLRRLGRQNTAESDDLKSPSSSSSKSNENDLNSAATIEVMNESLSDRASRLRQELLQDSRPVARGQYGTELARAAELDWTTSSGGGGELAVSQLRDPATTTTTPRHREIHEAMAAMQAYYSDADGSQPQPQPTAQAAAPVRFRQAHSQPAPTSRQSESDVDNSASVGGNVRRRATAFEQQIMAGARKNIKEKQEPAIVGGDHHLDAFAGGQPRRGRGSAATTDGNLTDTDQLSQVLNEALNMSFESATKQQQQQRRSKSTGKLHFTADVPPPPPQQRQSSDWYRSSVDESPSVPRASTLSPTGPPEPAIRPATVTQQFAERSQRISGLEDSLMDEIESLAAMLSQEASQLEGLDRDKRRPAKAWQQQQSGGTADSDSEYARVTPVSQQRGGNKQQSTTDPTDRSMAFSPLESSIFSDSLENIMSDFEEALNRPPQQQQLPRTSTQRGRLPAPAQQAPAAAACYASDVESSQASTGRRSAIDFVSRPVGRGGSGTGGGSKYDGYQSDHSGYAVPSLGRSSARPPTRNPLPSAQSLFTNGTAAGSSSSSSTRHLAQPAPLLATSDAQLLEQRRYAYRSTGLTSMSGPVDPLPPPHRAGNGLLSRERSVESLRSSSLNRSRDAFHRGAAAASVDPNSHRIEELEFEKRRLAEQLRAAQSELHRRPTGAYSSAASTTTTATANGYLSSTDDASAPRKPPPPPVPPKAGTGSSSRSAPGTPQMAQKQMFSAGLPPSGSLRRHDTGSSGYVSDSPMTQVDRSARLVATTMYSSSTHIQHSASTDRTSVNRSTTAAASALSPPQPLSHKQPAPAAPVQRAISVDAVNKPPPPKVPPKPVRPAGERSRTTSASLGEGFHSMRRLNASPSPAPSFRRHGSSPGGGRDRDEASVSDSEAAFNDQRPATLDRFASLRRSRQMLAATSRAVASNSGRYTPSGGGGGAVSDAEEYTSPAPRYARTQSSMSGYAGGSLTDTEEGGYSTASLSRHQRPPVVSGGARKSNQSLASSSQLAGSTDFFKDQVSQWRQEFTRQTGSRQSQESLSTGPPLPLPKLTRDNYTMTLPPAKHSIGCTANIDPPKIKSSITAEIKAGCQACDNRLAGRGRATTGTMTAPLPLPKAQGVCLDCIQMKDKLGRLEASGAMKIRHDVATATDGQDAKPVSFGVNTDRVQMVDMESTARIAEPKPPVLNVRTMTDTPQTFEIGMTTEPACGVECAAQTEPAPSTSQACGTEAHELLLMGASVHAGVGTECQSATIGVGTEAGVTGVGGGAVPTADGATETELDLDALLADLQKSQHRPPVNNSSTNTERPAPPRDKGVGTDRVLQMHAHTSTQPPQPAAEQHSQTESVDVRNPTERRVVSVMTDKTSTRSVFVNTAAPPAHVHRSTETFTRMFERGTEPDAMMKMWNRPAELQPPSTPLLPVASPTVSAADGSSLSETSDSAVQTDSMIPEEPTPRVMDETQRHDDDELWLMPEAMTKHTVTHDVGTGDGSVDFVEKSECEACCARLQQEQEQSQQQQPEQQQQQQQQQSQQQHQQQPQQMRNMGTNTYPLEDGPVEQRECAKCQAGSSGEQQSSNRSRIEPRRPRFAAKSASPSTDSNSDDRLTSDSPTTQPRGHQLTPDSGVPDTSTTTTASAPPSAASPAHSQSSIDSDIQMDDLDDVHIVDNDDGDYAPQPPKKVDFSKPRATRAFEMSKAAALKKLLTSDEASESSPKSNGNGNGNFRRGTALSKSARVTSRKGDSLAYITDKNKKATTTAPGATVETGSGAKIAKPVQARTDSGLSNKVQIKNKESPTKPQTNGTSGKKPSPPAPIPAKIPRPKFTKYGAPPPNSTTPEEEEEAHDRLAPLRSELVMVRSWPASPPRPQRKGYDNAGCEADGDAEADANGKPRIGEVQPMPTGTKSASPESDDSDADSLTEGSYSADGTISRTCDSIMTDSMEDTALPPAEFEMTAPMTEAAEILNAHCLGSSQSADVSAEKQQWATQYLQHEWLKAAARRCSNSQYVEAFLDALEAYSPQLLTKVVNMVDLNENSALHYSVSHGNFDIVSLLLDSKVCNLNLSNKAGYTPVMLAALCPIGNDTEKMVVQRLFHMGDINVKASQHGQTALMLAVSHGKFETAQMLVAAGAGLNVQDEDGSTALMCAAEHGHAPIVRWLLNQPDIDATRADFDGSTALSIAVENGHREIGVLIYAHLNYGKSMPTTTNEPSTTAPAAASST